VSSVISVAKEAKKQRKIWRVSRKFALLADPAFIPHFLSLALDGHFPYDPAAFLSLALGHSLILGLAVLALATVSAEKTGG